MTCTILWLHSPACKAGYHLVKSSIALLLVQALLYSSPPVRAADPNVRLLVLDNPVGKYKEDSRLMLIDTDLARPFAQTQLGYHADVALSPRGDLIAAMSMYTLAGVGQSGARLEIYSSRDLHLIKKGALPPAYIRSDYTLWPRFPRMQFSPKGDEIVIQQMDSYLTDEKPVRRTVDNTVLTCLKVELSEGTFQATRKSVRVPRCRMASFVRIADWPRAVIWNAHLGALEVVDFDKGEVVSRQAITDDPVLKTFDVESLEKPIIGNVVDRLQGLRGTVISIDGRTGVYVPNSIEGQQAGYFRKVDLTTSPPRIIMKGKQREGDLRADSVVVSSKDGALFVVKNTFDAKRVELPSRGIRAFEVQTLWPLRDVSTSVHADFLACTPDGTLLCVLDRGVNAGRPRMAVVTVKGGEELKVIDQVGRGPVMIWPLAAPKSQE